MGRRDLHPYCLGVFALTLLLSSTSQFVIAEEALSNKEVITGETTPEAEDAYAPERWNIQDPRISGRGRIQFLLTIDGELISIEEKYRGCSRPIDFFKAKEGGGDFIASLFEIVEGRGQYKRKKLGHISPKGKCTVFQEGDNKEATTQSRENIPLSLPEQWPHMASKKASAEIPPNLIVVADELQAKAKKKTQPEGAIGWFWMDWEKHFVAGREGGPFPKTVYWIEKKNADFRLYKKDDSGEEETIALVLNSNMRIYWESDRKSNIAVSQEEADYWDVINQEGNIFYTEGMVLWRGMRNYEESLTLTDGNRFIVYYSLREYVERERDKFKRRFE